MSGLVRGRGTIPRAVVAILVAILAVPGWAGECREKVIEWIREPARTTKKITVDGKLVYHNTWLPDASGESRPIGPGWIDGSHGATHEAAPRLMPEEPPPAPPPPPPPPRKKRVPKEAAAARKVALGLVGIPYRVGGTSRKGLNSAGVAWFFCDQMGLDLSQEILAQYRSGRFVLKRDIQPGDLIFHHSESASHEVPDMVGVALGEGEIVYMSGSRKKVIRANIDTPWWEKRYKGARRLLGNLPRKPRKLASDAGGLVSREKAVEKSPAKAEKKHRTIEGMASYYGCGDGFHSSGTASGEVFDENKMTTAHYDLPFGTRLEVTNLGNGKKVQVRVNDRGPFEKKNGKWVRHSTRILDLSCRAATQLGFKSAGLARVRARILD